MTHTFHAGELASTRWTPTVGEARASAGPGGVSVLIAVAGPGESECRAVEAGRILLGIQDDLQGGTLLIRIGELGRPGYIEAAAALDVGTVWWGGDIELALCDAQGVVLAVRRFQGLEAAPVHRSWR